MAEEKNRDFSKLAVPVLVILLMVAAFLIGSLFNQLKSTQGEKKTEVTQSGQTPTASETGQEAAKNETGALTAEDRSKIEQSVLVKGDSQAKVTLVEFSDYQCPYCQVAASAVKQVYEQFNGQIRIIFRNFPLEFHQYAKTAALASLCANEQGKFWEYHDKVFENQKSLNDTSLKTWAKELGLNQTQFSSCLESKKYDSQVNDDVSLGMKIGVGGTPTIYINGKMVSWQSQSEGWPAALKRYLEAELKT